MNIFSLTHSRHSFARALCEYIYKKNYENRGCWTQINHPSTITMCCWCIHACASHKILKNNSIKFIALSERRKKKHIIKCVWLSLTHSVACALYIYTIQLQILSSRVKRNALENKRIVNYAIFELHVIVRERVYMWWEKFNSSSLITIHHSPLRELTFVTRKLQ